MTRNALILSLGLALGLAGCATTADIYHPAADFRSVGYSDSHPTGNLYRVTFVAPQSAGRQATDDLALLRAADLTTTNGHTWFKVDRRVDSEIEVDRPKTTVQTNSSQNMNCSDPTHPGCSYTPSDNSVGGVTLGMQGVSERRLVSWIDIEMGDGPAPQGDQTYDAKATAARIRASMK